ncbi:MAG: lysylphosphatidylglycerol synthase transmembrane domain-containing protein [Candidatus Woesearchaeota archaeon]
MKLRTIILGSIGIGLFIYLLQSIGITQIIKTFNTVSPTYLIPYLSISILIFLGLVFRWKLILSTTGKNVRFNDLFWYSLGGYFVSYVTPSSKIGGEGIKIYLLMKEKKVEFEQATSSVVLDRIIELSTNGLFTIIAVLIFIFSFSIPANLLWLLIVLVIASTSIIFIYYYRIFNQKLFFYPILKFLRLERFSVIKKYEIKILLAEKKMMHFHNEHKNIFVFSIALSLFLLFLSLLEFKFLALLFGYDLAFSHIFFILTFVGIATMVPIPGSLGAMEGLQVALFTALGHKKELGFTIAILTRIRDSIWCFLGLFYLYKKGMSYQDIITNQNKELDPRIVYFRKWKNKTTASTKDKKEE